MATPCRVAFFVMRRCNTPRPRNSTCQQPAKFCSSAKNVAKNVAVSRKFLTFVL